MKRINNIYFRISLIIIFLIPFLQIGKITNLGHMVEHGYGLPFRFIKIYQKNYEKKWLVNNLFKGNDGVNIRIIEYILSVLILYLLINGVLYLYKKFQYKKC